MNLIYIITNKCNFSCLYCRTLKKEQSISEKIIKESLKLFRILDIDKVKFFGGEPLIEFEKLKMISKNLAPNKISLYLTTNGSLINKEIINWINENRINLNLSLDGSELITRKYRKGIYNYKKLVFLKDSLSEKITVNMVICPETAKYLFQSFKFLVANNFEKINLLPAYFNDWQFMQLESLKKNLNLIIKFLKTNRLKIFFQNIENYSQISFFNEAVVIDVDGQVYSNNSLLIELLNKYKQKFLIGNIFDKDIINKIKKYKFGDDAKKLNYIIPLKFKEVNSQLDKSINNFVNSYKKIKYEE